MSGPAEPGPEPGEVRTAGLRAVLASTEAALGPEAPSSARLDMYRDFLRLEEKRLEEERAKASRPFRYMSF